MALALSVLLSFVTVVAQERPELSDPSCLLQTVAGQQLSIVDAPEGWTEVCSDCRCDPGSVTDTKVPSTDADDCATYCGSSNYMAFVSSVIPGGQDECECCKDNPVQSEVVGPARIYKKDPGAGVVGDPHIKTLDGRHYTLLSQGTFLLWRLGMETELPKLKKAPVQWEIYTHYSGHQSFTKGLLLMDTSGGSVRQALEITSQKCEWRARKADHQWTVVKPSESEVISDANDASTFKLMKTHGSKYHNQVQLKINTKDGKEDIAVLTLSCRPNHNLNLHITMKRRGDEQRVEGEVKVARKALSNLQTSATSATSKDSEFSTERKWQDLGGSAEAAAYLRSVDELESGDVAGKLSALQSSAFSCQHEKRTEAENICSKHLAAVQHELSDDTFKDFFSDCVFDVCGGAGETAAELAAELLVSTQAV